MNKKLKENLINEDINIGTHNMLLNKLKEELNYASFAVSTSPSFYQKEFLKYVYELQDKIDYYESLDNEIREKTLKLRLEK